LRINNTVFLVGASVADSQGQFGVFIVIPRVYWKKPGYASS
jgi:hypothetical protein